MVHVLRSIAPLLLVAATGCATVTGTLAGPVTAPLSLFKHTRGMTPEWTKVLAIPIVIPIGPFLGFFTGAQADIGYVENGSYDTPGEFPFESVWDPANPEWGRKPMHEGSVETHPGSWEKMSER